MSLRLAPLLIDSPIIRPSARVRAVADMLGDDPSHIRRMVKAGDLQAHRHGKRGIRIFLDSVEAYQRDQTINGQSRAAKNCAPPKVMSGATKTAHRHAVNFLESIGLMRPLHKSAL